MHRLKRFSEVSMPVGVINSKKDEDKWKKASNIAKKSGKKDNYAYIMGIYKKMKPDHQFTKKAGEYYYSEIEKISSITGLDSNTEDALAMASAAVGIGGAIGMGFLPSEKMPLRPDAPVIVVHTDDSRGAGHKKQGKAIEEALKKKGVPVKLVNLDDYAKPGKLEEFNRYFKPPDIPVPKKDLPGYAIKAYDYYTNGIDWNRFSKDTAGSQIVNMHSGMDMFLQRHVESPIYTVHTDQAPFKMLNPLFQNKMGSFSQHIATTTAAPILKKEYPSLKGRIHTISSLPIVPPKQTINKILPKGYNITISGGALGMGVEDSLRTVLRSKNLPKGATIHVVTGYLGKRGHRLYDAELMSRLDSMKGVATGLGVSLKVEGFADLPKMLQEADLNIVRPGGTTLAEARSTGKPFKIFLDNAAAKSGPSYRNTFAMEDLYKPKIKGSIYIQQDRVAPLDEFFENAAKQEKGYSKLSVAPDGGADEIVKLIRSKKFAKNTPTAPLVRRLAQFNLGRVGLGSLGFLAYKNRKKLFGGQNEKTR